MNYNQSINGYRIDSRDRKAVKQSKELNYLNPKKGSEEALEALTDAVDADNKLDKPRRNCFNKEEEFRDYDDPKNPYGKPSRLYAELMCMGCPLFQLCEDYVKVGKPAFGVWAGKRYGDALIFDDEENN